MEATEQKVLVHVVANWTTHHAFKTSKAPYVVEKETEKQFRFARGYGYQKVLYKAAVGEMSMNTTNPTYMTAEVWCYERDVESMVRIMREKMTTALLDYQKAIATMLEPSKTGEDNAKDELEVLHWRTTTALKASRLQYVDSAQERMEMILQGDYDNRRNEALKDDQYLHGGAL